mmetsp:Transcript_18671/g.26965  ORF Transcript_18671/g.26965 Transcript_18671/m.26965 type:complete len:243 (-) Transcript_18671:3137-3865(-)
MKRRIVMKKKSWGKRRIILVLLKVVLLVQEQQVDYSIILIYHPRRYYLHQIPSLLPNVVVFSPCRKKHRRHRKKDQRILDEEVTKRESPSVRAIATAIFLFIIMMLSMSVFFYPSKQQFAISLLFSPLGSLTRWKLSKYNSYMPGFPLGTFACNLLACALSGSLGSLLAGNPGPEESIVLVSMISGFAGSLSSLAAFVVEVLSLIDPIIFKFDGVTYACVTLFWAIFIGFTTSQAKDWADEI